MRMSVTPARNLSGVEGTSQKLMLVEELALLYTEVTSCLSLDVHPDVMKERGLLPLRAAPPMFM